MATQTNQLTIEFDEIESLRTVRFTFDITDANVGNSKHYIEGKFHELGEEEWELSGITYVGITCNEGANNEITYFYDEETEESFIFTVFTNIKTNTGKTIEYTKTKVWWYYQPETEGEDGQWVLHENCAVEYEPAPGEKDPEEEKESVTNLTFTLDSGVTLTNGETIRFTFDSFNQNDPSVSTIYFEGTVSKSESGVITITNITCEGMTFNESTTITVTNYTSGKHSFTITDVTASDGTELSTSYNRLWTKTTSTANWTINNDFQTDKIVVQNTHKPGSSIVVPDQVGETVDLGLSVLWSTTNIGATSVYEYGAYYAWGETIQKTFYSWDNYTKAKGDKYSMKKYCNKKEFGTVDNKTILESDDDIATNIWGVGWSLPSFKQVQELEDSCTWEKKQTEDGIVYFEGTSKITGYTDNSIILPATGYYYGTENRMIKKHTCMWSKTLNEDNPNRGKTLALSNAYCEDKSLEQYGDCIAANFQDDYLRCCGLPVRPVKNKS